MMRQARERDAGEMSKRRAQRMGSLGAKAGYFVKQRSFQIALIVWAGISEAMVTLCHGTMPLPMGPRPPKPLSFVIESQTSLVLLVLLIGLVSLITRRRPMPDLAARAPERATALRETIGLWIYCAAVLVAGRFIGLHYFGAGIAMHLNGSLVGATRVQSPAEVYTWAAYNGILLALVPYLAFRIRGYSNEQLNLHSSNLWSDVVVIAVVLAIGCFFDIALGGSFVSLTRHQRIFGGLLSFALHLAGTDLPVMIFIYSILLPRYEKLTPPVTAFLLGAASYPAIHVFESWTRYDSPAHSAASLMAVFLLFFPAGLMKSFLTLRTGNAWVHVWAFHAISPHVTVDTRLIVHDFNIR
jgi:hypothetical protein